MTATPRPRLRGAYALAVVAFCAAVMFGPGHGPTTRGTLPGAGESVSAVSSATHAALLVSPARLTSIRVAALRPARDRVLVLDALLLAAALLGALSVVRRRVRAPRSDRVATSTVFARRRGPPVLLLTR